MALKKKYQNVSATVSEINADVDNNASTETVVMEPITEQKKEVPASAIADLLTPPKEELKSASLTLRMKPSVKKSFVKFCEKKGISQADMFEFWVQSIIK